MIGIGLLVEGDLDEAVGRRLAAHADPEIDRVFPKHGSGYIKRRVDGFRRAAAAQPILALVDMMDTGLGCAPEILTAWLTGRHPDFLFRVVVREVESWLLADDRGLSRFLEVDRRKLPAEPECLLDPKRALVDLARRSRSRRVRRLLVPEPESGAVVGLSYNRELQRFVRESWSPEDAARRAESLGRCVRALRALRSRL